MDDCDLIDRALVALATSRNVDRLRATLACAFVDNVAAGPRYLSFHTVYDSIRGVVVVGDVEPPPCSIFGMRGRSGVAYSGLSWALNSSSRWDNQLFKSSSQSPLILPLGPTKRPSESRCTICLLSGAQKARNTESRCGG